MTEKRFTKCDTKIRDDGEEMTQAEVRDMLNKLHEENEKLKQDLEEYCNFSLHDVLDKKNKENGQLKSEIEKLSYANEDLLEEKRIWKQMSDEYTKLSDENEQLRKDATTLVYSNQDYRHENEQLKSEITILKGGYDVYEEIIGELKAENEKLKKENKWLKSIHFANDVLKENKLLKEKLNEILELTEMTGMIHLRKAEIKSIIKR